MQSALRAAERGRVFVACAGAWWDSRGGLVSKGALELSPGASAFVQLCPDFAPARRRLDAGFRRCDEERLLFWCQAFSPVYDEASRSSFGRRAHPQLRLRRLPLVNESGAWEPRVSICVGTTLHEPLPLLPNIALDERAGKMRKLSEVIKRTEATAFEKRLLFLPQHRTKRARRGSTPLADESARTSLCLSGLRFAQERCPACLQPAHISRPSICASCGSRARPWSCSSCGSTRHLAITTSKGVEDWICVFCNKLNGAPASGSSTASSADAPYTLNIDSGCSHPALAAGWAWRISALLPQGHWARIRHDGCTLDATCAPSKLSSTAARRKTRLYPGQKGYSLESATADALRLWPVSAIRNDRKAAAAVLGNAEARSTGTLLQQLMTPAALADTQRLTPLQLAATVAGGITTL